VKKYLFFSVLGFLFLIPGHLILAQTGPVGKCLTMNGIDQYFFVPNHSGFNIAIGESYTLTCRIKAENFDNAYSILTKGNELGITGRYELATAKTSTAPNLALRLRNSDNTDLGAPYLTILEAGKWVHIAWVYSAAEKSSRVYINGILVNTLINSVIGRKKIENPDELLVGCGLTDAANPLRFQYWPGQIDELRIWKKALSTVEVQLDATDANASPNGLVAAYNFENISNNVVPDVSGKGRNGQIFGYGIRVIRNLLPVGIGEKNERLFAFRINAESSSESVRDITVDFTGTNDLSNVTSVMAYYNGKEERLNPATATLFGAAIPSSGQTRITGNFPLKPGANYFWITANINPTAREGNQITASVSSYTNGSGSVVKVPEIKGSRTILLTNKLLFSSGDGGSKNYRIPAIVTASDGSLVTATDQRWNNPLDLPNDIDVVIRRSTDKGLTWSPALTIAGNGSTSGYGDPALIADRKNRKLLCLFAGGNGFFGSTAAAPIRIYQSGSSDNGITWSSPQNITPQVYGAESGNPATRDWQGAFVTSGAATQLKSGRLIAVLTVRENTSRTISNFVLYSDDYARTWVVSPYRAAMNGNEAKIVELDNGHLLMSIRNQGTRLFNISKDQGLTWGLPWPQPAIVDPSCNGDMLRYTSMSSGYNKNRLLHSIPYSSLRSNLSILMSYDEGGTWPVKKTIYPGPSAYSCLTILRDGTIGIYYEVGEYDIYQMYFTRFSLDWLSNGTDTWTKRWINMMNTSTDIVENHPEFSVYPNPAVDFATISGPFDRNTPVEIYDDRGVLMNTARIENASGPVQISLQRFPAGLYFVKIGGWVSKLVVK